jgi:phosphomannomutase/phosphoglucomutase
MVTNEIKVVEKPWGREIWYAVTDRYAGKILEVKAGHALSLQYHRQKKESLYFRRGTGTLLLGDKTLRIEPGLSVTVEPGTQHRVEAETDLEILEVSTPHLDDVVRLEDRYGRTEAATAADPALPPVIFREYDIRGVYGKTLTDETARLVGRAFAGLARERGFREVLVGRDNRVSSPSLAKALIEGITEMGLDVLEIGQVVTPVLYWARTFYGIDPAVMVTASHNPGDENGFKVCLGPATLYGEAIQELYRRAQAARTAPLAERKGRVRTADVIPSYTEMMAGRVALDRPLKVVVDAGNGSAGPIAPQLFRRLGCEVIELYCESDPSFPNHHPDPVRPENLQDLIKKVRETGADLGLAFDGDADRLGVVDDQGQILWGDQLMILFWREILPRYPGATALVEVKCSQALVEEIERLGGKPVFHRTGHSYIKKSLKEMNGPFAGEMSGHLFFADEYYGFDDALYAGARLCRLVARSGKPLSALWTDVPRYPSTPEVRVGCPEELKQQVVEGVRQHFQGRYEVLDVDGARVLFPGGWGLVRASNTQPVLVVRCEGRTEADLEAIKAEMEGALRRFPEIGPVDWR